MYIMFKCSNCNHQTDGILVKRTDYGNTANLDELDVCCLFCGKVLARAYTSRSFIDSDQEKLWEENKRRDKLGK